jgi:GR25 family glycosyltransferase involved in LPS biosynthesis
MEDRSSARDWFESHVRVYVLNLPSDEKRWERSFAALSAQRVRATRVFGVDMRGPGALETAKESGWMPRGFNITRAQEVAAEPRQRLEGSILGTVGCASAHFKAQAQALDEGAGLALVLEDDSLPEPDFVERLWSLVREELPCDWQVASLMSRCPYGKCVTKHLLRVQPDGNEPAWGCRHGVNWGMHAMLYRTDSLREVQRAWKARVFNEETPRCLDVDVALASISDEVAYYAVPSSQMPGFLREGDGHSARWDINMAQTTAAPSTVTTTVTTPLAVVDVAAPTKVPLGGGLAAVMVLEGMGCSNYEEISLGPEAVEEGGAAACAQKCFSEPGCVGFQRRSATECDGRGGQQGSCQLWRSYACVSEENSCWDQYTIQVPQVDQGSCKTYGCVEHDPANICHCDSQCVDNGSCCSDIVEVCGEADKDLFPAQHVRGST